MPQVGLVVPLLREGCLELLNSSQFLMIPEALLAQGHPDITRHLNALSRCGPLKSVAEVKKIVFLPLKKIRYNAFSDLRTWCWS